MDYLDGDYDEELEEVIFEKDMTRAIRRKNKFRCIRNKSIKTNKIDKYERENFEYRSLHGLYHPKEKKGYSSTRDKRLIQMCKSKIKDYMDGDHFDINRFWYWDDAVIMTQIQNRESDRDILLEYICSTDDDVVIHHDGTVSYSEKYVDWIKRVDFYNNCFEYNLK